MCVVYCFIYLKVIEKREKPFFEVSRFFCVMQIGLCFSKFSMFRTTLPNTFVLDRFHPKFIYISSRKHHHFFAKLRPDTTGKEHTEAKIHGSSIRMFDAIHSAVRRGWFELAVQLIDSKCLLGWSSHYWRDIIVFQKVGLFHWVTCKNHYLLKQTWLFSFVFLTKCSWCWSEKLCENTCSNMVRKSGLDENQHTSCFINIAIFLEIKTNERTNTKKCIYTPLKLTACTWKMVVGRRSFPFGIAYF